MLDKYTNWQSSVKSLNDDAVRLDDARRKCYEWMSNKIKDTCRRYRIPIPTIHFTSDAEMIECSWHEEQDLFIPVDFILDLHMGFDFMFELMDNRKMLVFYPFKEVKR